MSSIDSTDRLAPTERRVSNAIASAAARTGVDFDFLVNQARIESRMNPNAKARTSTATGLFQFTKQTWLATIKSHGSKHDLGWAADAIAQRKDGSFSVGDPAMRRAILDLRTQPEAASSMAAEFAADNGEYLNKKLDRAPEQVDLYLAHFLGAGGAASFLKAYDENPDGAAAPLLPAAAAANRSIFYNSSGGYRSFAEIRNNFANKLGQKNVMPSAGSYASGPAARFASLQSGNSRSAPTSDREYLQMRSIEPMPQRLSLDFARSTYQRLSNMSGGGVS